MLIKTITENGATVDWTLKVCGDSNNKCFNTQVAFTIPTGVRLTGPISEGSSIVDVSKGFYKTTNTTWYIGTLLKTECTETSFTFTVDDISQATNGRFDITASLTSSCTDGGPENNTVGLIIETEEDCEDCGISLTNNTGSSTSDLSLKA